MKGYFEASVLQNSQIAPGIFDIRLQCRQAAADAACGQFLAVYTGDASMILPRPLSICEIDRDWGVFRVVYRIAGEGTRLISRFVPGDTVRIIAPLGNPFLIDQSHKRFAVVGGGIGVPPLLELAKEIRNTVPGAKIFVYLGFREELGVILTNDFEKIADTLQITTDDGSFGAKGDTVSFIKYSGERFDAVYACGPHGMLKSLSEWAVASDTNCFVSMEERMACNVGACLACVVKLRLDSGFEHARVCLAGPVFNAKELIWE